ncbi:hypothetical protein PPACK8108_LOCUS15414 [Phakopsora pachyrhizi]|uniref:Uncharacterized protein n=1 Tax=Phakopsora pachyrhizi TaxID=170000 RepID=A0AAV0B649_PHAPC|nr:hypothetical protein PPACK8108_LOCUS15414 [Phakopsora pachyrhizi]
MKKLKSPVAFGEEFVLDEKFDGVGEGAFVGESETVVRRSETVEEYDKIQPRSFPKRMMSVDGRKKGIKPESSSCANDRRVPVMGVPNHASHPLSTDSRYDHGFHQAAHMVRASEEDVVVERTAGWFSLCETEEVLWVGGMGFGVAFLDSPQSGPGRILGDQCLEEAMNMDGAGARFPRRMFFRAALRSDDAPKFERGVKRGRLEVDGVVHIALNRVTSLIYELIALGTFELMTNQAALGLGSAKIRNILLKCVDSCDSGLRGPSLRLGKSPQKLGFLRTRCNTRFKPRKKALHDGRTMSFIRVVSRETAFNLLGAKMGSTKNWIGIKLHNTHNPGAAWPQGKFIYTSTGPGYPAIKKKLSRFWNKGYPLSRKLVIYAFIPKLSIYISPNPEAPTGDVFVALRDGEFCDDNNEHAGILPLLRGFPEEESVSASKSGGDTEDDSKALSSHKVAYSPKIVLKQFTNSIPYLAEPVVESDPRVKPRKALPRE